MARSPPVTGPSTGAGVGAVQGTPPSCSADAADGASPASHRVSAAGHPRRPAAPFPADIRPIRVRIYGEDHEAEIPHTPRNACQRPFRPTIYRAAPSAHPWTAGKADVTSHPGVVADSANPDVVLIGGGIMSATLAELLGVVAPQWSVTVFESAAEVAGESSDAWNNAGTGHSALCELNYTPAGPDGRVDPAKAVTINEQFQQSRQFWSHLVREGLSGGSPKEFITPVPHIGFVTGEAGRAYMRARYDALAAQPLFADLEYTEDAAELAEWIPL